MKNLKKMRKLTCKVLAACAVSSTLLLVNGGTVYAQFTDTVYGGSFITEEQSTATVNGKAVSIPGGKYSVDEYTAEIAGGYVKITNQLADSVAITNGNTVSITRGSFHGSIAGGFADVTLPENKDVITGAGGGKAQADNNTVTISGAGFYSQSNSDISGGFARNLNFGDAQANGNTVEIDKIEITVRLDGSALLTRSIYGGYATGSSNGSTTANDNKLTISGANIELMPPAEGFSPSTIYAGFATNGANNTANNNTSNSNANINNNFGDFNNNIEKDYYDKLEAILDFESAAYTKPDKPLNAYDTLKKYYKDYLNDKDIINILNKYNLNSSYTVLDDKEGINYLKKYDNIKEEDIIKEINDYLKRINKEDEIK